MRYRKQEIIAAQLGWENFKKEVFTFYTENTMSANEIAELIERSLPNNLKHLAITPRSISRAIIIFGRTQGIPKATRNIKESFNNAIRRGRIHWAYKENKIQRKALSPKIRMEILKRDNFKCVLCGAGAKDDLLEIDHILAWCKGGLSIPENMRTLCYACNKGKQYTEKETGGGTFRGHRIIEGPSSWEEELRKGMMSA